MISGPAEFGRLQQGDVLVTATTTEAFNIVLPLIGALVTDTGGLLSHAAIVSREYGIPGIVGCKVATSQIKDGTRVTVNGTEVAHGPVRSDPKRAHYDLVDLAPHLHPGENVVGILARTVGGDGNLLLNVGPMPDGRIEPRQTEVLRQVGAWLKQCTSISIISRT